MMVKTHLSLSHDSKLKGGAERMEVAGKRHFGIWRSQVPVSDGWKHKMMPVTGSNPAYR